MFHQPRKDVLYRLAVTHGIQAVEELCQHLPMAPSARVSGWLSKFLQLPKNFAPTRRYVNRFKLGADPEFCFGRTDASGRTDAALLGLMQGPAFGADNNGRLAEIRPHPSRSAVEVVASVLTTLRWLSLLYPETMKYPWESGAYLWDDGIGGHVHFGRKRPQRKQEIEALDHVEECMLALDMYPRDQINRRRKPHGPGGRNVYGQPGDYRLQPHGYEYRTYPSWLDSPALAFITLVASKLAVQVPDLYRFRGLGNVLEMARLRNLFAYFKTMDDDARLALVLLDRGLPRHTGGDFKLRWGIRWDNSLKNPMPKSTIQVIPPSIKPDPQAVEEIFDHLREAKPIQFRVPKITWSPIAPPPNYNMCIAHASTVQHKGLGEMIWDLCSHNSSVIYLQSCQKGSYALLVGRDVASRLPQGWKKLVGTVPTTVMDLKPGQILIAPEWREGGRARLMKRALLSGAFPLWRVQDCKPDSYDKWKAGIKPVKQEFVGKVVFKSGDFPNGLST